MIEPTLSPIHILIVEDDENDFLITSGYIKKIPRGNFVIQWCPTYEEAISNLTLGENDMYFVDYFLDRKTGLDLLEEAIKKVVKNPSSFLRGLAIPNWILKPSGWERLISS
jgi:response regulator of citrate/malate metabolism